MSIPPVSKKCALLLKMFQEDEINAVFPTEHFSFHLPLHPYPSPWRPQIAPRMNMSTFLFVCERELAWFSLVSSIQIQPAFVCAHTDTHMHPHRGNPNTATHINWDFMNLISSGYTCILHGLLPIHLKSYQTKKYIPSVKLSLSGGFATTTWAPFKQTFNVGAYIQFETSRKGI